MIYSTEEFEDAVYAGLTVNLPGAVAAITARYAAKDAERNRPIEIPLPRVGEAPSGDYYLGAAGEIVRWPAIEIGVPSIDLGEFDLAQRDADGSGPLIVVTHASHAQKDVLRRVLLRLTACVSEVAIASLRVLGPTIANVRILYAWNPETGENDEVQSSSILVLTLQTTNLAP